MTDEQRSEDFWLGFGEAMKEAGDAWQRRSAQRVFVAGTLVDRPTAAERRESRESVLREAHEAEMHVRRHVPDCPLCSNPIRVTSPVPGAEVIAMTPVQAFHAGYYKGYLAAGLHHNRDYGASRGLCHCDRLAEPHAFGASGCESA